MKEIINWKGDKAQYTGVQEDLYGWRFYEIEMLEGHMKGEKKFIVQEPKK